MSKNSDSTPSHQLVGRERHGAFLRETLNLLPEDKQDALREKTAEALINLQVKASEGDLKNAQGEDQLDMFARQAERLSRMGDDYTLKQSIDTSTGTLEQSVSKSNSKVVIVIAVIIGVVAVLVLAQ